MAEQMQRVPVDETTDKQEKKPIISQNNEPTEITCKCPLLDPDDWNAVESDWSDIQFLRGTTPAVLGVPLRFSATRDRLVKKAKQLGGKLPEDAMILVGNGKFRRDILVELDNNRKIPSNKKIFDPGGVSFTKIYEAPWGQMRNLMTEFETQATARYGRRPDKTWVWYLTCQICTTERNFETLFVAHYKNGKTG
jgi:hypothetical protein